KFYTKQLLLNTSREHRPYTTCKLENADESIVRMY
ncbi:unnamed protein product, partial [Parnassius apollo]